MSVGIETDESLKETLHELAHGRGKENIFNDGYQEGGDQRLYEGLVKAQEAGGIESRVRRYQETLK